MQKCEQAKGLNMLEHGKMVYRSYAALINSLKTGTNNIDILQQLYAKYSCSIPPIEVLKKYLYLHDCGKHLCLVIGEDGKRRYPNHAEISADLYATFFPDDGFTAQLIRRDMGFHTLKGDDLLKLCKSPFAPILYFTAWAEIAANAEMFGGTQSESYKIKRSRLIQSGKKLLNSLKGN